MTAQIDKSKLEQRQQGAAQEAQHARPATGMCRVNAVRIAKMRRANLEKKRWKDLKLEVEEVAVVLSLP